MSGVLKASYVACIGALRVGASRLGALSWLERKSGHSRFALWVRSLFAIYDMDDFMGLGTPWWTFASQDMVARFLGTRRSARVLEYGSGASTLWLADRAGEVHSIEHDRACAQTMERYAHGRRNVRLHYVPPVPGEGGVQSGRPEWVGKDFSHYVSAMDRIGGEFDLIVIDGRCRSQCLAKSLEHLKPDGLILFDNARRARYRSAIEEAALVRVETRGLTPCLPYPDSTFLLARSRAVLRDIEG